MKDSLVEKKLTFNQFLADFGYPKFHLWVPNPSQLLMHDPKNNGNDSSIELPISSKKNAKYGSIAYLLYLLYTKYNSMITLPK